MERKGFFRLSGPKGSYCWKLSVLSIALSVVGCGEPQHEYVGDPGPFASCYYQNLTNVSLPQGPTVLDAGQIWTYARRLDDVWLAVLDVVSQYQGILALDSHGTERSMLIMRAREDQRAPENQVRLATFGGFYEQWLAITVIQATESDATRVAVAVFQPDSGRLTNNEQAALRIFRQIQIQLVSPTLWTEKFVGPELEQYAVRAHAEPEPRSGKKRSYRYDELGSLLGNWVSKRLQVELVCVCCPEVTARLDDAIRCLAIAAGEPDLSVHVVIIASENVNAFALPNGDIYVSSGLLDSLDSLDEVAAVLAHELDHLIHHDATEHLRTKHGAAAGSQLVQTSAFVGGTILGILLQSPSMGSSSLGSSIGGSMAQGAIDAAGRYGAGQMEVGIVSGFTAKTELRADANGMKTLYKAGFDPEANLRMLYILRDLKERTLEKGELIASGLINMNPGIDQRIEHMKNAMVALQQE